MAGVADVSIVPCELYAFLLSIEAALNSCPSVSLSFHYARRDWQLPMQTWPPARLRAPSWRSSCTLRSSSLPQIRCAVGVLFFRGLGGCTVAAVMARLGGGCLSPLHLQTHYPAPCQPCLQAALAVAAAATATAVQQRGNMLQERDAAQVRCASVVLGLGWRRWQAWPLS